MKIYKLQTDIWFLERMIYLIAGIFVLASAILSILVSKYFIILTILVGSMLIFFSLTGYCPMAILLKNIGIKEKIKNE